MSDTTAPARRPNNPHFSSGPCSKRPGWSFESLSDAPLGRSHRAKLGKAKLKEAIDKTREILGVPDDYRIGIVPASDTGAVEMALWVSAWCPRHRHSRLGKLWCWLGDRRRQTAQTR